MATDEISIDVGLQRDGFPAEEMRMTEAAPLREM